MSVQSVMFALHESKLYESKLDSIQNTISNSTNAKDLANVGFDLNSLLSNRVNKVLKPYLNDLLPVMKDLWSPSTNFSWHKEPVVSGWIFSGSKLEFRFKLRAVWHRSSDLVNLPCVLTLDYDGKSSKFTNPKYTVKRNHEDFWPSKTQIQPLFKAITSDKQIQVIAGTVYELETKRSN